MNKQERMMASMREREKVVQHSLAASLRERDREREQHLKDEAIQHFNALMADMVISWFFRMNITQHPARKSLDCQKEVPAYSCAHLSLLVGHHVGSDLIHFLAGGCKRQPTLGLVFCVYFVL